MPTVPRRPAAQRERERLQARRLRAAELFAAGVRQAEAARQLGISAQAVSVWRRRGKAGGPEALRSKGPSGPAPRLSEMRDWIRTQRSWLVVERLPAHAPEFNPVEGLWSSRLWSWPTWPCPRSPR